MPRQRDILRILRDREFHSFIDIVNEFSKVYDSEYANPNSLYQSVNQYLHTMLKEELVNRSGQRRNFLYSISDIGIQKLKGEL